MSWQSILESLAPRLSGVRLEDRIHKMLKKAEDFTPETEDDYKEEMELLEGIMEAHTLYTEEKGLFNDMFGDYLVETEQLNFGAGQFFTPMNLVRMMCQMTLSMEELKDKVNRINDPAAGCGRFMLGTAEVYHKELGFYNFIFYNTDIDFRMYVYCTMNAILHAIPSLNVWGNSLTYEFYEGVIVVPGTPLRWKFLTGEQVLEIMPKPQGPKRGLENFMEVPKNIRARRERTRKEVPARQQLLLGDESGDKE